MGSERHEDALIHHRDELSRVQWSAPLDAWRPTRDVLSWLYQLEELHKKRQGKKSYERERDQQSEGRALAGLVWIRGKSVHWNVDAAFFTLSMPKPSSGGGYPVRRSYPVAEWHRRAALPSFQPPDGNGRDVMYDQHVAGRSVLDPIDDAIRYLKTLTF